jgi:hypothetical protein
MFIQVMAIPANADEQTVKRMETKLLPLRLAAADMAILRKEFARIHAELTAHRESVAAAYERAKVAGTEDVNVPNRAAKEVRDNLTWASYTRLLQTLSPSGAQQLAAQIARIKSQIKSVGPASR